MTAFLRLEAYDAVRSALTLVQNPSVNPAVVLLDTVDWGNAEWEIAYSGARGGLGARGVTGQIKNRTIRLPLRYYGTSKDDLTAKLSALAAQVDLIRRYGGRVTRQALNGSYKQHLDVLGVPGVTLDAWGDRAEIMNTADVSLNLTCAPFAHGDSMDVNDDFTRDTVNGGYASNYTVTATGALTNLGVSGNALASVANPTVENRLIHTSTGYTYGDVQVTLKFFPGATVTNAKFGVILKWLDANNFLEAYVDDNGTNSRLRIDKVINNVRTNLNSTNLAARIAQTQYAVRGRMEGNTFIGEFFNGAGLANVNALVYTPAVGATNSVSQTFFTNSDLALFGSTREGKCGLSVLPQVAGAAVTDFEVWTYVYRNWTIPEEFPLAGVIPGDAPALMTAEISSDPQWWALGWYRRPRVYNMVQNGAMEDGLLTMTMWDSTAITNICAAGGGIAFDTSFFKYGNPRTSAGKSLRVTTQSANADSGASTRVNGTFKASRLYLAIAWVMGIASTANVAIRLGNSPGADFATGSNVALSTSVFKMVAVTWSPTLNRDSAHVAVIRRTAGASDVFDLDGVCVVEVRPAFVTSSIASTTATTATLYAYPADWPPDPETEPFLAMVDSELILVTDRSGNTITFSRGREGTTAATHASDSMIMALPVNRLQYEGLGARPPYGVYDAETGEWTHGTLSSSTGNRGFGTVGVTGTTDAPDVAQYLDATLVDADEGGSLGGEVTLLAFNMQKPHGSNTSRAWNITWVYYWLNPGGSGASPIVYAMEFGSAYRGLAKPAAGAQLWFSQKLGTWRLRRIPARVRFENIIGVDAVAGVGGGGDFANNHHLDYAISFPSRACCLHPTGVSLPSIATITNPTWRIDPDLAVSVTQGSRTFMPAGSLGGELMEVPPGTVTVLVWGQGWAPDGAPEGQSTAITAPTYTASTRFSFTPRWAILR